MSQLYAVYILAEKTRRSTIINLINDSCIKSLPRFKYFAVKNDSNQCCNTPTPDSLVFS